MNIEIESDLTFALLGSKMIYYVVKEMKNNITLKVFVGILSTRIIKELVVFVYCRKN